MQILNKAKLLVGHNILGYDLPVLKKLFDWERPKNCRVRDTQILSQVLDYKRFGMKGHSLEAWGRFLNNPKIEFDDYSKYVPEMVPYCQQDCALNLEVYHYLMRELNVLAKKSPLIPYFLKAEQYATEWAAEASRVGWPFNVEKAKKLMEVLESELENAYDKLESKLGYKIVCPDKYKGTYPHKEPKWTKVGFYDANLCKWFDIEPPSGFEGEERLVEGPYVRIVVKPLSLDSLDDVKLFLFRHGWVPTEYNRRKDKDTGEWRTTSPKITEDSLELLGGDGALYTEFLSVKSRHGVISTWLENVDADGNLHGECMMVGTPSMRARHSIIANVPSIDARYGKEMRELFIARPGWVMVGCDSKGNQARALAHYLKNDDFIQTLLHGDIHQYNADVLTEVLLEMKIEHVVPRSSAKRILYAFLFGASGGKLWSYIFGTVDKQKGNKLKRGFLKAVPGFKDLIDKLEKIYSKTGGQNNFGYIPSLCGNKIYVDSYHKLLVYLLQAAEKITCSTALMLTVEEFQRRNIPYIPCIYYHDEIDFMVPEEYAEEAAAIGRQAFKDGPELYGVTIMDGDSKIGPTWLEVH
jgi:hypothetical protein